MKISVLEVFTVDDEPVFQDRRAEVLKALSALRVQRLNLVYNTDCFVFSQ